MDELQLKDDEKTFAMLAHVSTFGLPVLGPLIIYLIKKDESEYVAYHAVQAMIMHGANLALTFFVVLPCYFLSLGMCFPIIFVPWIPTGYSIYQGIQAYNGTWAGYVGLEQFGRPEGR